MEWRGVTRQMVNQPPSHPSVPPRPPFVPTYMMTQHHGSLPTTSADRAAFKASILEWSSPNADEENFTEAIAAAFRACTKTTVGGDGGCS